MGLSDKVVAAYMAANMKNSITKASSDYHPEDHNMHSRKYYTNTSVVIIGAGISGICCAIDMIRKNKNKSRDFVILEKGSHIGGTWNDNKYPGCCCDVWSHLYSYSFEPNPYWTRKYPGQEEIHAYLVSICEKWGLYKHIRFNTSVDEAVWDDATSQWRVAVTVSGEKTAQYGANYTINGDFLISGVGQLNMPRYPDIEGLDKFQGKTMHSARWDWSYPLAGKRIGIIGSGATAAQIIPEVSKVASSVTVFQRTPNWIIPREDEPISPIMHAALDYIPGLRSRYRALLMDIRESLYDSTIVKGTEGNDVLREWATAFMHKQVPNRPDLWEKLTPNYSPGCKRILISDDFYPAMGQKHVHLETDKISRVTEKGVVVKHAEGEEEFEFDLLVLATGFQTNEFLYPIKIRGQGGRDISEIWKGGAHAYLGVSVESLPNFGIMYGPNTNLGHNSIILMIEAQSNYINGLIGAVLEAKKEGKKLAIVPKTQRVLEWNKELQERLGQLTFSDPNCQSWYKTKEGLITNNWAGTVVEYQKTLSGIEWLRDYEVSGDGKEVVDKRTAKSGRQYVGRVVEETVVPVIALTTYSALAGLGWATFKVLNKNGAVTKALSSVMG